MQDFIIYMINKTKINFTYEIFDVNIFYFYIIFFIYVIFIQ